jgi:hypothetical protein
MLVVVGLVLTALPLSGREPDPAKSWLDAPLANWNTAGAAVPKGPATSYDAILERCNLTILRSTEAERAVADAGWISFKLNDRKLAQRDVEIVSGMSGADDQCGPTGFHAFVFVGGHFAGTLTPDPMTTGRDGVTGVIRLLPNDTIRVDFSRYRPEDPPCCPVSHVNADYTVDRKGAHPLVVPVELKKTR